MVGVAQAVFGGAERDPNGRPLGRQNGVGQAGTDRSVGLGDSGRGSPRRWPPSSCFRRNHCPPGSLRVPACSLLDGGPGRRSDVGGGQKRGAARLLGRPDPGPVDVAKALPLAYAVSVLFLLMSVLLMYADIVEADQHVSADDRAGILAGILRPMTVSLGMPAVPAGGGRSARRPAGSRWVRSRSGEGPDLGPVDDDDTDDRCQRDAAADRRAHRDRLRHRPAVVCPARRRGRAARDRPAPQIPVIADIHFSPSTSSPRSTPAAPRCA